MAKQKVALTTLLIALVIGTLIGGVQTASTQIADTTLAHEELHALAQGLIETSGNVDQMLDAEDNRTVAGDQIVAVGQGITGILSFGSSRTGTYDIYSKSILGGRLVPKDDLRLVTMKSVNAIDAPAVIRYDEGILKQGADNA